MAELILRYFVEKRTEHPLKLKKELLAPYCRGEHETAVVELVELLLQVHDQQRPVVVHLVDRHEQFFETSNLHLREVSSLARSYLVLGQMPFHGFVVR